MSANEIVKPFLSKTIRVCDRCGKMDIKTYAKYELQNGKYVLVGAYSGCQNCEKTEDFSKEDLKCELRWK